MAEQEHNKAVESGEEVVEVQDRGLFDFTRKKEEMKDEEALSTGVEKIHIDEEVKVEEEDKKEGLLEKLHRSHSSSSSSSSDEEETFEGEKKKKKKKGLKEKIKEKIGCDKKEGEEKQAIADEGDDTAVVVEKIEESVKIEAVAAPEEEKKGFLDKIKEKLPGNKKPVAAEEIPQPVVEPDAHGQEGKEKKGFLGKIMDKLPGYSKAAKESEN